MLSDDIEQTDYCHLLAICDVTTKEEFELFSRSKILDTDDDTDVYEWKDADSWISFFSCFHNCLFIFFVVIKFLSENELFLFFFHQICHAKSLVLLLKYGKLESNFCNESTILNRDNSKG